MDPVDRFSARADVYARARPSYPPETLAILRADHALGPGTVVADLGSGTGILTRLLLDSGATVKAVEPNRDMRVEAERALGHHPRFHSVAGRAEETTLDDASVDLVTAAQAFHWFDVPRFRTELRRILRPGGRAALIWNDRDLDGTPFLREYEAILLERCPGYRELQGKSSDAAKLDAVFGPAAWSRRGLANEQRLDRAGLVQRVMSSSYAPRPGSPGHDALIEALGAAFDRHAEGGEVALRYTTMIIGGHPA